MSKVTVREYQGYTGAESVVLTTIVGPLMRACDLGHVWKRRFQAQGIHTFVSVDHI